MFSVAPLLTGVSSSLLLLTRANASMFLERQIQNVESVVSGFEQQLAKDGAVPDQTHALLSRSQQLQVLNRSQRKHFVSLVFVGFFINLCTFSSVPSIRPLVRTLPPRRMN